MYGETGKLVFEALLHTLHSKFNRDDNRVLPVTQHLEDAKFIDLSISSLISTITHIMLMWRDNWDNLPKGYDLLPKVGRVNLLLSMYIDSPGQLKADFDISTELLIRVLEDEQFRQQLLSNEIASNASSLNVSRTIGKNLEIVQYWFFPHDSVHEDSEVDDTYDSSSSNLSSLDSVILKKSFQSPPLQNPEVEKSLHVLKQAYHNLHPDKTTADDYQLRKGILNQLLKKLHQPDKNGLLPIDTAEGRESLISTYVKLLQHGTHLSQCTMCCE